MSLIIKNPKHVKSRVLLGLLLILLFAISPVIIGLIGAWLTEMQTGEPCNEANCYWGAFGWYIFYTMPIAGLMLTVFILVIIRDTIENSKKKD